MTNKEVERRRRIRLSVAAYAYEVHDDSVMSDGEFDKECLLVDISQTTEMKCDKCGNNTFKQTMMLRKVSAIVSPNGQETIIPVGVFSRSCMACPSPDGYPGHMANAIECPKTLQSKPLLQKYQTLPDSMQCTTR